MHIYVSAENLQKRHADLKDTSYIIEKHPHKVSCRITFVFTLVMMDLFIVHPFFWHLTTKYTTNNAVQITVVMRMETDK